MRGPVCSDERLKKGDLSLGIDISIDELSEKYSLGSDVVASEVRSALVSVFRRVTGVDVSVFVTDTVSISGLFENRGVFDSRRFDLSLTKRNVVRAVKHEVEKFLWVRKTKDEYERLRHMSGSVVFGSVCRIADGTWYVEIQNMEGRGTDVVVASCGRALQAPRERGMALAGTLMPFHVLSVDMLLLEGVPRVRVSLSRISKALVEGLLKRELARTAVDAGVMCEKRIAGAVSHIRASEKLPQECIKKVSDMLKESIVVRWGDRK